MATIRVPYETAENAGTTLSLDVPDGNLAARYVPQEPEGISDVTAALLHAVENPVGGKKLSQLLRPGAKVTFVTENQFRAAQANVLLPPLVRKAQEAGAHVSIAIGCGKVPPLSSEEIEEKLGAELVGRGIPVVCNDVSQAENYSFIGNTRAGTPLWILKIVADADVVITLSTTQATLWGYGGSGMIIPAVTGNETIETNHVMSLAPDCIPGNNDCAMQLDKYEALKMVGVDMGINVVVANNWDIVHVNAGDPVAAHRAAVEFYDGIYKFDFQGQEKFDIVIAGSTAPTNHLFFHTGWALVNCLPITKEGGSIIFASPCPGYHTWPGFALMDLMGEYMPATPENHERIMKTFYQREKELWAGCIWYPIFKTHLKHHIHVVTADENVEMAGNAGLNVSTSLESAFQDAIKKQGAHARVAFVPCGRYTVFSA